MRKNRRFLAALLALTLALAMPTTGVASTRYKVGDVVASGSCGKTKNDHVNWTLTVDEAYYFDSDDGEDWNIYWCTLAFTGSGQMKDFELYIIDKGDLIPPNSKQPPWATYAVRSIRIDEGVTSIGKNAFAYQSLESVVIPSSVSQIGSGAFEGVFFDDFTMYGVKGSYAESFAKKSGIRFAEIDGASPQTISFGDADGDGAINGFDSSLILQFEVGKIGADRLNLAAADVDGSGTVDGFDASLILQYEVGKITAFPAAR